PHLAAQRNFQNRRSVEFLSDRQHRREKYLDLLATESHGLQYSQPFPVAPVLERTPASAAVECRWPPGSSDRTVQLSESVPSSRQALYWPWCRTDTSRLADGDALWWVW